MSQPIGLLLFTDGAIDHAVEASQVVRFACETHPGGEGEEDTYRITVHLKNHEALGFTTFDYDEYTRLIDRYFDAVGGNSQRP